MLWLIAGWKTARVGQGTAGRGGVEESRLGSGEMGEVVNLSIVDWFESTLVSR